MVRGVARRVAGCVARGAARGVARVAASAIVVLAAEHNHFELAPARLA